MPVLEDMPREEKVRRANVILRTRPRDVEETLVQLINDDDQVIAFLSGSSKNDVLVVETDKGGKRFDLPADPKQASARGGKGGQIVKRAQLTVVPRPVTIVPLANADVGQGVN